MFSNKLHGSIIVTYRCDAVCNVCNCYNNPSNTKDEISLDIIKKLPEMSVANITGGEPFIREDLEQIVEELYKKSERIIISTNGSYPDKILDLCKKFPQLGIRISLEGMEENNDKIKGLPGNWQQGYDTIMELLETGHKDVGFAITLQDENYKDLMPLYELSDKHSLEFSTCAVHNSFYFGKLDNKIEKKHEIAEELEKLINELLKSKSPKKWVRAYFNHGLINYIYEQHRLLPCGMANHGFVLDPHGMVLSCTGSAKERPMGDLNEKEWEKIWKSQKARKERDDVKCCTSNCWMMDCVVPTVKRRIWVPLFWILVHKIKGGYKLSENKFIKDEL